MTFLGQAATSAKTPWSGCSTYILFFLLPIQFNRYRGVFFGHTAEWSGPFPLPSSKAPFLNCYHDVYKVLWYAVLVCCEGSLVLEISILRDPSFQEFWDRHETNRFFIGFLPVFCPVFCFSTYDLYMKCSFCKIIGPFDLLQL